MVEGEVCVGLVERVLHALIIIMVGSWSRRNELLKNRNYIKKTCVPRGFSSRFLQMLSFAVSFYGNFGRGLQLFG